MNLAFFLSCTICHTHTCFITMRIFFFIAFLFTGSIAQLQNSEMIQFEDSLAHFLEGIVTSSADDEKLMNSMKLEELMNSSLANPAVFEHDFSAVKKMAILKPKDEAFMIFNWNIPLNNGVNEFKAYLVLPTKTGENKVEEFKIPNRKEKKLESRYLDLDQWYGCLYYEVIPIKKGKTTVYTLLGYSPEKKALTKKYIDVLTIRNSQPRLGEAIFEGDKGLKKRVIFEFSSEVSMAVRYQASNDRIVLDHLTPRSPEMEGNFQFYGPDGTFDAYELDKDTWKLQKNVSFQATEKSNKVYRDPRFFRKRKK